MNSETIKRLNFLGEEREQLHSNLRYSDYNVPLNRAPEKEKLFEAYRAGRPYNPQFEYQPIPDDFINSFQVFLQTLRPDNDEWEALLFSDVQATISDLKALRTHDPTDITLASVATKGLPSRSLVEAAQSNFGQVIENEEEKTVSAESAKEFISLTLNRIGLMDWKVTTKATMNAGMQVHAAGKEIHIRPDKMFSEEHLRRLLVHEIGTHVFRYMNGEAQPLKLLRSGLAGYLDTEEGMAAYNQLKFGLRDYTNTRSYASHVIAIHLSLTHSFYDVFCHLAEHTSLESAFGTAVRAKRGFIDTSDYGSDVKDKVYFEGFLNVTRHLEKHPDNYSMLMSGKVSINDLPKLEQLKREGLLIDPMFLPEMLL